MAVTAPLVMGPMRMADVSAVLEIERLSFTAPWPAYAFEQELKGNRLAHYLVARAGDAVVGFAGVWMMVDEAHGCGVLGARGAGEAREAARPRR